MKLFFSSFVSTAKVFLWDKRTLSFILSTSSFPFSLILVYRFLLSVSHLSRDTYPIFDSRFKTPMIFVLSTATKFANFVCSSLSFCVSTNKIENIIGVKPSNLHSELNNAVCFRSPNCLTAGF